MIFENYLASFYDFHRWFSIEATTQIIDCNKFDVKFIIYQLSKLNNFNYRLSILHKNKPYYIQDII